MALKHLLALAAAALSSPAWAQETPQPPLPDPESAANHWTVALGGGWIPDYVGSDDHKWIPVGAVRGMIGPVAITSRASWLYADLVPRGKGVDFDAGPILGVRFDRTGSVKDDLVDLLPERNKAIEVGGFAGVSLHDLTNPYDTLSFRLDVLRDVGSAHKSTIFSPNIEFSTPLSRRTYASASVGADFVSDKFADYYFTISAADALASGLPAFDADGGLHKWKAGLIVNQSLTGDLTGGLSIFGAAQYSRLAGDFKRSPIVSQRGSASQWLLAAGLAYTF